MINTFGQWTPEEDYLLYPKEKWCNCDIVANYIRQQNYVPKTSLENLVEMIFLHFEGEIEDGDSEFLPDYNNDSMINIEKIRFFVEASGGLKEFDYEC